MKKALLFFSIASIAYAYGVEVAPSSLQEKNITLCNDDTCTQATITPYSADRDHSDVMKLIDNNQLKLPEITFERLAPCFNHETKNFNQPSPMGSVICDIIHSAYVLRDAEKVLGFVACIISDTKEPMPMTIGSIMLLVVEQPYQFSGEEQLLAYALQSISDKKATAVSAMIHEDNVIQRSVLEKNGFIDNSSQMKSMFENMKKSMTEEQIADSNIPESKDHCHFMKNLEENITQEMKNPAPIESSLLNITQANFEQEVLNADMPVIIDAYADWCAPCRKFAPIFEEVASDYTNYKFVRFNNIPEEVKLSQKLGIESLPTTLFVKNKKVIGKETGFMNKETFQEKIVEYFNS